MSFSLATSKILSFCLILGNVIMMCLSVFLLGYTFWGLYGLPGLLGSLFPLTDWGRSSSLFVQISFQFLALVLLLWHPYDLDVGTFKVVPEVPKPVLIVLNFRFLILF